MRAVVDHRDLAALNGARPGRTSSFAWGSVPAMAAIAGIFLAEELSNLTVDTSRCSSSTRSRPRSSAASAAFRSRTSAA